MANVWAEVDAYVAKHNRQVKRLVELCAAGKLKRPKFIAPCVWVLATRAKDNVPSERSSFSSFEAAETFAKSKADAVAAAAEAKRLKKLERSKGRQSARRTPPLNQSKPSR